MLVLAFLILLPAAALGFNKCNTTILDNFFEVVDQNKDTNVTKKEALDFFDVVDLNHNGKVTLPEVKTISPTIAPKLVGDEEYVFRLLDIFSDGEITKYELFLDFTFIDRNFDGVKTKKEWDRFVGTLCPIINPNRSKGGCASLLCGLLNFGK